MLTIVLIAIVVALLFDFLNGMNDAANSIATIVATRVFSPTMAVLWAAFWNFSAIFIFGVSVAHTMGEGIVEPTKINEFLILAALLGSVVWVWLCTRFGMPISVSHALIGGLIGPVWFTYGSSALVFSGIFKIAIFIVLSPLIGLILGFIMMCITLRIFHKQHPVKVEGLFKAFQLFSSAIFSLGHGANDAQKTMGIIAILLFSVAGSNEFVSEYLYNNTGQFHVPLWLIFTCYSVIALGTIIGGKKVIKTLGDGLAKLKPVQGFCAETAGALTLIGTAVLGIPVSTTHTITGSIIGVGITKGVASVRWATASNIVVAWILTIPATIVMSGLVYWIMGLFLPIPE
ncbi:inorganic phosphate transporter [uncultured Sanguibacteroides sp.]|uniref:inorganic phosphate transporter n=1 Tax=uncultured Sanguibacteroides sp. TaxID=1635151 RepID=UPI0025E0B6C6|nr:inorganic phosphate transporter [uncultured Sanguibacteroides sp.]